MKKLQMFAGVASISEAIIYMSAFIYFGLFFNFPHGTDAVEAVNFLTENQLSLTIVTFAMYILFGCLLGLLVVGLHNQLGKTGSPLVQVASIFGAVWVGLVIASGMISNIGLNAALNISTESPEKALDVWNIVSIVVESLGGGNELVGGLWVLLISIAALKLQKLSRYLNYLGIFVGVAGISTIYPAEALTEIFGVTQIVWFLWLGIVFIRLSKMSKPNT